MDVHDSGILNSVGTILTWSAEYLWRPQNIYHTELGLAILVTLRSVSQAGPRIFIVFIYMLSMRYSVKWLNKCTVNAIWLDRL